MPTLKNHPTVFDDKKEKSRLLENLNDEQKQPVIENSGPIAIFAGAGSGKTRIITTRIAYLVQQGVKPWQILAVTFTNKAAGEMKERVNNLILLGNKCHIATFHSICVQILREFSELLGFSSHFSIYDEDDSKSALKSVLKSLEIDSKLHPVDAYLNAIKTAKMRGMIPSEIQELNDFQDFFPPAGATVYQRYQEFLQTCNAMDFGDLLLNVLILLRHNQDARRRLERRYAHILVDEYQDTNAIQFEIVSYLAAKARSICVVGDDDQSIYSWRGASPQHLLNFESFFPGAKRFILTQNYRSTSTIVEAANKMIAHNKVRAEKNLWTQNQPGELIEFVRESDSQMESWWVIDRIQRYRHEIGLRSMAIFYRTNSLSRPVEEALTRENIPYRVYGSLRFYDRVEIKDMLAYLKLITNTDDDISFKRIVNVPARGIGKTSLDKLATEARTNLLSLFKSLETNTLPARARQKLLDFSKLMEELKTLASTCLPSELLVQLIDRIGYKEYIEKKYPDQIQDKIEHLHELVNGIAEFEQKHPNPSLDLWLQSVTLLTSEEDDAGDALTLMTLHMAKGLEFKHVYLMGMEDGLLPHKNSLDSQEAIEEERRLFYVGMTRARERLHLTCSVVRRQFNDSVAHPPSRFLREIPSQYFATQHVAEYEDLNHNATIEPPGSTGESNDLQYDFGPMEPSRKDYKQNIKVGSPVRHLTYGKGVVEKIVEEFGDTKVIVLFRQFGRKKVNAHHLEI